MIFLEKVKHEVQQNEDERMKSLHVRLNQEAEKIRKWKVQTEVELKMKVFYIIIIRFITLLFALIKIISLYKSYVNIQSIKCPNVILPT